MEVSSTMEVVVVQWQVGDQQLFHEQDDNGNILKIFAPLIWPSAAGEMGPHYHPTEVAQEEFPEQEEESTAEVGLGPCLWYYLQKLCRRLPPEIDIFMDIVDLFKGFS